MSIIDTPVATIASTMLYLTISEYICIQPAADVEPAKVKKIVQSLSSIISLNILEAFAVSLDVKDILPIELDYLSESKSVISICVTGFFKNDFLLCPSVGPFFFVH